MSRSAAALILLVAMASGAAWAERGVIGDPTKPTALKDRGVETRRESRPRWQLQSTILGAGRSAAVINGKKLHVGDAVDGAILLEVRSDGVTLQVQRKRMDLSLGPRTANIRKDAN